VRDKEKGSGGIFPLFLFLGMGNGESAFSLFLFPFQSPPPSLYFLYTTHVILILFVPF